MQMDFLSAIPDVAKPMPPIGPGPDGTPPLPLINQPSPVPPRPVFPVFKSETVENTETGEDMSDKPKDDVFESDPFFSQEPVTLQPEPESSSEAEEPAVEPDVIPPETDDASFDVYALEAPEAETPPPVAVATAEERLLNSIVGEPEAAQAETPPRDSSAELAALQTELEDALAKAKSAVAAHTQTRQDLQILKTRFSTLESDLVAARGETAKAVQMKVQAEAMHADTERQWSDKLAQLRRMLDEVEEIRDEQLRKRVPKLLFIGTLVTGVLATAFAYFIGANQAAREQTADNPPPSPRVAVAPPTLPPAKPLLTSGPAPHDVVPPRPVPAGSMAVTPVATPVRSMQPQVLQPANWPALDGGRWRATESGREMVITFHYGIFTRGVELSSDARQDLKTIATAIKAKGNRFRIEVEGHTDSAKGSGGKSSASNNKSLGLARAKTAASYLVKSCGLPATAVTTSSVGEDNPPYPNTTLENQKKNRTVVIRITASTP
jgi:flagellar motor protein MotB